MGWAGDDWQDVSVEPREMIWPMVGILFYALLSAVAYACEPWIGIGIASCVLFEMLIGCKFID